MKRGLLRRPHIIWPKTLGIPLIGSPVYNELSWLNEYTKWHACTKLWVTINLLGVNCTTPVVGRLVSGMLSSCATSRESLFHREQYNPKGKLNAMNVWWPLGIHIHEQYTRHQFRGSEGHLCNTYVLQSHSMVKKDKHLFGWRDMSHTCQKLNCCIDSAVFSFIGGRATRMTPIGSAPPRGHGAPPPIHEVSRGRTSTTDVSSSVSHFESRKMANSIYTIKQLMLVMHIIQILVYSIIWILIIHWGWWWCTQTTSAEFPVDLLQWSQNTKIH